MSSGTDSLMGLLLDSSLEREDKKAKIRLMIQNDAGEELAAFLHSLDKAEKIKLLSNSITKFGENVPLRQAIHQSSYRCIRSLILAGADLGIPDGGKAILGRTILLFEKKEDARLAYVVLQSYQGSLKDLPFASAVHPFSSPMKTITRSHYTAWRLLPLLALLGLTPIVGPNHDDMKILSERMSIESVSDPNLEEDRRDQPGPPSSSLEASQFKRSIYEWLDAYYSNGHHHSLKNKCRILIRKSLRVPDEVQIEKLRLPSTIKDYMLLRHAV